MKTNLFHSFTALFIIAALLIVSTPFMIRTSAETPVHRGADSADEPQLISGAEELYALAQRVNSGDPCEGETFLLTADIVLNDISDFDEWSASNPPANIWVPIGDALIVEGFEQGRYFGGHFDGGGHSITGAYIRASAGLNGIGLFGILRGGSVRNLSLHSFYIPEGANRCGGVVGRAYDAEITNCIASGTARANSTCGGIVGEFDGGVIMDCSASVHVNASLSAGGIVGSCANAEITRCRTIGSVSASNYTGGIAGLTGDCTLTECASESIVNSIENAASMVGFCFSTTFIQCIGGGEVHCGDYAGGIIGGAQYSNIYSCKSCTLIDAERYAGGAAGMCCGTEILHFKNLGNISGEYYIGGVVGWSYNGAEFGSVSPLESPEDPESYGSGVVIRESCNEGNITGQWGIGGLIGDCHDTEVYDCYNAGEVYSLQYAGGITGYTADCIIERCYNAGRVSGGSPIDPIIGSNSENSTAVDACYYLNTSCASQSQHGTALTDEQMRAAENYSGFDFAAVWMMDESSEYPYAELRGISESAAPIPGDIDANGSITVADAVMALRAALGLTELTPEQRIAADIDGNGAVGAADAVIILRTAMGLI